jgi:hypothetical protein
MEKKGRKRGKEKEKGGSQKVKINENREKLRQTGHDRSQKQCVMREGKNIILEGGGGDKYNFQTEI